MRAKRDKSARASVVVRMGVSHRRMVSCSALANAKRSTRVGVAERKAGPILRCTADPEGSRSGRG